MEDTLSALTDYIPVVLTMVFLVPYVFIIIIGFEVKKCFEGIQSDLENIRVECLTRGQPDHYFVLYNAVCKVKLWMRLWMFSMWVPGFLFFGQFGYMLRSLDPMDPSTVSWDVVKVSWAFPAVMVVGILTGAYCWWSKERLVQWISSLP